MWAVRRPRDNEQSSLMTPWAVKLPGHVTRFAATPGALGARTQLTPVAALGLATPLFGAPRPEPVVVLAGVTELIPPPT
jgi:hypothetical protein